MLLEIKNLNKVFGEMYALSDVSVSIEEGEFHALVGENGAGKSTLIKILTGVYTLTSGRILWQGKEVDIKNPRESRELGINVIHQDRHLVPAFKGVENVYLGLDYPQKGGRVDWKSMRKRVEELMGQLSINIPLDLPAAKLSPPQRTQLEIVRAMMTDCKLLILDEPTASLTDQEAEQLFKIIATLREKRTAILYVSHRMDEVLALSTRISVLKNGAMVETLKREETNKEQIISLMTDRWQSGNKERNRGDFSKTALEVKNIASLDGIVKDVSFSVREGEILGIFGLGGAGRTEVVECVYGLRHKTAGSVRLFGREYKNASPRSSIDAGMTLVSEDRRGAGLITNLSVQDNTVVSVLKKYTKFGVVDDKAQRKDTQDMIKKLSVKTTGPKQTVGELSGGNQQKVVFSKSLMPEPKIILCDEPTQAVDIKTRHEIHRLLIDMAERGAAVVFVSSDIKEVLEISDSVQVIAAGRSRERFLNDGLTAEAVLASCYAEQ